MVLNLLLLLLLLLLKKESERECIIIYINKVNIFKPNHYLIRQQQPFL
jgi:hypothetical protein